MERPYTGLTALIQMNDNTIGYMNNVELNFEKDIAEILQFGAQYREKVPTIKNWNASADGTVAFEAGGSQEKLYLAYESGELVTLKIKLSENVYFEGEALIASLSISGSPDAELTISADFEGSGATTFNLPQLITVIIRSGLGGTTNPAGTIKILADGTVNVTCIPSTGKTADKYFVGEGTTGTAIASNAFALHADDLTDGDIIRVTFKDATT